MSELGNSLASLMTGNSDTDESLGSVLQRQEGRRLTRLHRAHTAAARAVPSAGTQD